MSGKIIGCTHLFLYPSLHSVPAKSWRRCFANQSAALIPHRFSLGACLDVAVSKPTSVGHQTLETDMEEDAIPSVLSVDWTTRGVVITFADGSSGLFRNELLYSLLSKAEAIPDVDEEET